MSLRTGHIRRSIRDIVDGAQGPYAPRLAGLFEYDEVVRVFQPGADIPLGQPHRYDVELDVHGAHEASPLGFGGSYRIVALPVLVTVETDIPPQLLTSPPPQNSRELRDTLKDTTKDRLDLVSQSLATPEAVATTADGQVTGIISGLLTGPSGAGFPEVSAGVWDVAAKLLTHEIRARALVRIDRP